MSLSIFLLHGRYHTIHGRIRSNLGQLCEKHKFKNRTPSLLVTVRKRTELFGVYLQVPVRRVPSRKVLQVGGCRLGFQLFHVQMNTHLVKDLLLLSREPMNNVLKQTKTIDGIWPDSFRIIERNLGHLDQPTLSKLIYGNTKGLYQIMDPNRAIPACKHGEGALGIELEPNCRQILVARRRRPNYLLFSDTKNGAGGQIRTDDLRFTKPLLCP